MHFTLCPQNEEIFFWPHSKQTKDKRDFLIQLFLSAHKNQRKERRGVEFYGHFQNLDEEISLCKKAYMYVCSRQTYSLL
jgi:hypothetical protein